MKPVFDPGLYAVLSPIDNLHPRLIRAWHDLAGRAAEPNPFFEPQWAVPAVRNLGVPMELLAVMVGTDMVACMPLFSHDRLGHRMALRTWSVPSVLGTPLVDPHYIQTALAMAVQFLAQRRFSPPLLYVSWLPAGGPVAAALHDAVNGRYPSWGHPPKMTRPRLERRPRMTYLEEAVSVRRRRRIKESRRALERALGKPATVVERAGDASVVEKFLAMEAQGWKGREGTAMTRIPGRAQYFREMCAGFAEAGRLRMLCYEAEGTTLAMKCDVAAGQGLYCVKKTYNENFARFSPGVLLEVEGLRVFHEGDALWMDSCTNDNDNPLDQLWPDSETFTTLTVALGGIVGWLAEHALPLARLSRRMLAMQHPDPLASD